MPTFTLSGAVVAILSWIVIMSLLNVIITTPSSNGTYLLGNTLTSNVVNIVKSINNSYTNTSSGSNSLVVNSAQSLNKTAKTLNGSAGVLATIGGYAFLPSGMATFIITTFTMPYTMIRIVSTLLQGAVLNGPSGTFYIAIIPFSISIITSAFVVWYVLEFVYKLLTPITKTEVGDI